MLAPEVWDFPPPKVHCSYKQHENLETVTDLIKVNNFYKSVIITCPDELNTDFAQELLTEDTDYYRISKCSLTEFLDRNFIEYFIKNGKVICLTADKICTTQNCAAITPDGILTLHVLDFIYQSLGLEGTKRPYNYYEIKIDLKNLRNTEKVRKALSKLEEFDFYLTWEPDDIKVCPSSIAKFFSDKNVCVSVHNISLRMVRPHINQIPTLVDTDIDEVVEWMGMLAHEADISPTEDYISTYFEPQCDNAINSTRICILIAKGFLTPTICTKLSQRLSEYVESRILENYWAAMSIQGLEESLWQFSSGIPRMFQSHNSSTNIFITQDCCMVYSAGQLKYS